MKNLNNLQEIVLHALEKLGGEADMVELRFQTMFQYPSHAMTMALRVLRKLGQVTYILDRTGGYRHGFWRLA